MKHSCLIALLFAVAAPAAAKNPPPGWGDSTQLPTGTPWVPPPGIVVEEQIMPFNTFFEHLEIGLTCKDDGATMTRPPMGHGGAVAVCLTLRNTSSQAKGAPDPVEGSSEPIEGASAPIEVVIPAGLTVISQNPGDQHGILLVEQKVRVGAGETIRVPLYMICMNDSREQTHAESRYRLGPVTDHPEAKKLIAFMADKQVPVTSAAGASGVGQIQSGEPISQLIYNVMADELKPVD